MKERKEAEPTTRVYLIGKYAHLERADGRKTILSLKTAQQRLKDLESGKIEHIRGKDLKEELVAVRKAIEILKKG